MPIWETAKTALCVSLVTLPRALCVPQSWKYARRMRRLQPVVLLVSSYLTLYRVCICYQPCAGNAAPPQLALRYTDWRSPIVSILDPRSYDIDCIKGQSQLR